MALRTQSVSEFLGFAPTLAVLTFAFLCSRLGVFFTLSLYKRYWIYASIDELARIALAVGGSLGVNYGLFFLLRAMGVVAPTFSASILFTESLFVFLAVGGSRFSARYAYRSMDRAVPKEDRVSTLIVGAGEAGALIASEMQSNASLRLWPAAFIDDDREKHGLTIRGVTVEGASRDIPAIARMYGVKNAVIALPSADGQAIRRIHAKCIKAGLETKTIPALAELLDGSVEVSQLRPVRIEDLLRRDPVRVSETAVAATIRGARVLITGGGGSIGAELCRQLLKYEPASLVIVDHSENAVFAMLSELGELKQKLGLSCDILGRIGDIRSVRRLDEIFDVGLPEIVFHAAAHKHVPLLEENVCEAVTNNVQGTRNVLDACVQYDVDRFVMLSTDKAVNPSNVMGATKRMAELLVKQTATEHNVPYVSVRFGNVLGSRGSVVPIFQDQIKNGGPITITHPEMERYFMSIPEAAQLVLQASAMAHGGEIYVLDMGEPIRILDLANDLIRLSGLEPGRDIEIVTSNIRPGEKLNEELFFSAEEVNPTEHDKIRVTSEKSDDPAMPFLQEEIANLIARAADEDTPNTRRLLGELFPENLSTSAEETTPSNNEDPAHVESTPDFVRSE